MAPVTWNRGPWATPQPAQPPVPQAAKPYQYLMEQRARQPQAAQPFMQGDEGGGSGGPGGPRGTGEYGPYGSTLGNLGQLGTRAIGPAIGLAMGAVPGPQSLVGLAIPFASLMSRLAGVQPGYDVMSTVPSLTDIQSTRDLQGHYAGDRAAAQRASDIAANNAQVAAEDWGMPTVRDYANPNQPGVEPGGFVGGVAPDPSVTSLDSVFGGAGAADPGASDTAGTADSTGGARGGSDGPDVARGGVFKTTRERRTRFHWGEPETGGETAIFVPESMKRRGMQGREPQVRRGLKKAYASLT